MGKKVNRLIAISAMFSFVLSGIFMLHVPAYADTQLPSVDQEDVVADADPVVPTVPPSPAVDTNSPAQAKIESVRSKKKRQITLKIGAANDAEGYEVVATLKPRKYTKSAALKAKDPVALALSQIGYREKKSNKKLYSFLANAGTNNYNKYWKELDPSYMGQPWCDAFVGWLFVKNFGSKKGNRMLCGGAYSYYTPYSAARYKKAKRWSKIPKVGDQVFFRSKPGKRISHTGIVVGVDSMHIVTVEGNNGTIELKNGQYADEGVATHILKRTNKRIVGYGHPRYSKKLKKRFKLLYGNGMDQVRVVSTERTSTLKGLKRASDYRVQVRAFRIVNGQKIWGAWSKVKTARVK